MALRCVVFVMLCVCFVQSDLNNWDVGSVTSMYWMFYKASNFNVRFPASCLLVVCCMVVFLVCVDVFCGNIVVLASCFVFGSC